MENYGYTENLNEYTQDRIRTKEFRENINVFNQKLIDCLLLNDDAGNLFIKDRYISSIDVTNHAQTV